MAEGSDEHPVLEIGATYASQVMFEDAVEKAYDGGFSFPKVSEMAELVDPIERTILEETNKERAAEQKDQLESIDDLVNDELASMSGDHRTPTAQHFPSVREVKPPHVKKERHSTDESFASQQEAAELREEMESIALRMKGIEDTLETILRERAIIPTHIDKLKESINSQLTLALDKLHSAVESSVSVDPTTVIKDIEEVRGDVIETATAAKSYLSVPPKQGSPIATPGVSLKGKRPFKPRK